MGKAPAVIIIARHGARLDAADNNWQAASSTPWDTPLSYGGWQQTRALGARIASLLHARDLAVNEDDGSSKRRSSDASYIGADRPGSSHSTHSSHSSHSARSHKRRKHRVVIHSSPFLRCVQSSISISAGMAQYQGNLAKLDAVDAVPPPKASKVFTPPQSRSQTLDSKSFIDRYGPNISLDSLTKARNPHHSEPAKARLRLDAFLGEWLSPDYFEFQSKPPPSRMMIAGAKAELLRSSEPIQGAKIIPAEESTLPHLTSHQASQNSQPAPDDNISLSELAKDLPVLGTNQRSMASVFRPAENHGQTPRSSGQRTPVASVKGYNPPMPMYAIAPSNPIPQGFVAHARDACVDIDFSWDSERAPQHWGDGGEYGEEWTSLHTRFRKGLRDMVHWYKGKSPDYDPQYEGSSEEQGNEEDDQDLVLIIVTHGAGCNALIGALTNQPVLLDVGMASLTMATHKGQDMLASSSTSEARSNGSNPPRSRRRSSIDIGLSMEYDMKLVASNDHLRMGADPHSIPQLSSPGLMPAIRERRFSSGLHSGTMSPVELDRPRARNSALGSIRRKNTASSVASRSYTGGARGVSPASSAGLWGSERRGSLADQEEAEMAMSPVTITGEAEDAEEATSGPGSLQPREPTRSGSALWGGGGSGMQPPSRSDSGLWSASSRGIAAARRGSTISSEFLS